MASHESVPDYLLERMKAGELSAAKTEALRARLRTDGEDGRLARLAESDAEILAALPPTEVAREIERRRARRQDGQARLARPMWALSLVAAGAASIAVLASLAREPSDPIIHSCGSYEGIKGDQHGPTLRIYRKAGTGTELLRPNADVKKGDDLQIRYLAAGKHFGVIASIDGRGTVTLHLPESAGPAAPLSRDGERALPHAYELDDSPKFERFVFVAADKPFTTEEVVQALRSGAALHPTLVSFEIALRKSP